MLYILADSAEKHNRQGIIQHQQVYHCSQRVIGPDYELSEMNEPQWVEFHVLGYFLAMLLTRCCLVTP